MKKPRQFRLSDQARNDLHDIWRYTAATYDVRQADAYDTLIFQALRDIAANPEWPTSQEHPELGTLVRSYRIELSKERSGTGIKSARHVVFYTLRHADWVYVVRILHDHMEPSKHMLED